MGWGGGKGEAECGVVDVCLLWCPPPNEWLRRETMRNEHVVCCREDRCLRHFGAESSGGDTSSISRCGMRKNRKNCKGKRNCKHNCTEHIRAAYTLRKLTERNGKCAQQTATDELLVVPNFSKECLRCLFNFDLSLFI